MLYLLFLFIVAFREEELSYPWFYAAILGAAEILGMKIVGHPWGSSLIAGAITWVYLGLTFSWLARTARFSFFWWVAFFLATLPVTGGYLLKGLHV